MHQDGQPRNFGYERESLMRLLKFRDKLDIYRRLKGLKVRDLAELTGIERDRMEDIYEGTHAPRAADVLRIMRGLQINFQPEDFEGKV